MLLPFKLHFKQCFASSIAVFMFIGVFAEALMGRFSSTETSFTIMTCSFVLISTGMVLPFFIKKSSRRKSIVFGLLVFALLIGVFAGLNVVKVGGSYEETWWDAQWQYRKVGRIHHEKVTADLNDFPVLIDINDSDLASYAQSGGGDIVFVDKISGIKLDHEIEFFDAVNGHLIAWVRIPLLSASTDTEFYVYYGNPDAVNQENPTGVWGSSFLMVQHLSETSGTHFDSSANHKDGVPYGSLSQNAVGKINGCDDFFGGYVQTPQVCTTENQFTFSVWIYARAGARYFISQWYNSQGVFFQIYGDNRVEMYINAKVISRSITLNAWHLVTGTYDGATGKLYVDASSPSSAVASGPVWTSQNMYIGNRYDRARKFVGLIDEVRVSNVPRTSEWIMTEYNNQNDPSSFYTIQSENKPVLQNPSPKDGETHVGLNPTLSVYVSSPPSHQMTVTFLSNVSGAWQELGTYVGGDGVYNQSTSNMNGFNTEYYWRVHVSDNESGDFANKTYHFKTILMLELKWVADVPAGGDNQLHPVIGDINGDGKMEVVMSGNGYVVALNGADGTELWRYRPAVHRSITLADLTNDGIPEILAAQGEGVGNDRVFALFGNGTLYWQRSVTGDGLCDFPVTAYDIDGDGYPTIYFATEDQNYTLVEDVPIYRGLGRLTMLNHKGEIVASTQTFHPCTGGPTVADYDFDGVFEVYMGDRNYGLGMGMRSWWAENLTLRWNQSAILTSSVVPVLVDFNSDQKLEVIGLSVPNNGIIVMNATDGSILQDDRQRDLPSHATPTVYDVDRDGNLEVILAMSRENLQQDFVIWDLGRRAIDVRINISSYDAWCAWPPTVGDVNGDGLMEIIAAIGTEPGEGNSAKDFPILIYEATASNTYQLAAEISASGGGCLSFARVQDIDEDDLNEVIVAGVNGKVFAYDTVAVTPLPKPRADVQYYSEYRRGAAEYVEPPGPHQPLVLDEYPKDGSTGLSPNPTLKVRVYDYQRDTVTAVFSINASGVWEDLGTYTGGNGVFSQPISIMGHFGTTYFWAANATDSSGHSTYRVYSFSTLAWWDSGWHFRKIITVDHNRVASDLQNFPVLIDVTDQDLMLHAQSDGHDIVFTDYSGNKLSHEIEFFDGTSGHMVAWVRVPALSSTENTALYMYYGNADCSNQADPEFVWDSSFLAVHHLEEVSGNATDSTSNHNDAVYTQATSQGALGKIGKAMEFGGANDYVQLPQVMSSQTQFTFSAWIYARAGARYFISQWYNSQGAFLQIYSNNRLEFYVNSKLVYKSITLNAWHFVVATFDGTTARLYLDGGSPSSASAPVVVWPSQNMYIGDRYDHTRKFNGFMDEVHISNVARSIAWITTEYRNQVDPTSFFTIGAEEAN